MSVNESQIQTSLNSISVKLDSMVSKMELLSCRVDKLEVTSSSTSTDEARSDDVWSQLAMDVTAIVGLHEAVTAKSKCMKCFWALLLLCGICGTALITFETGKQYLEHGSVTKVVMFKNASYNFPPILLCSDEWIDPRKARATGLSVEAVKYSLSYFDDWHGLEVENVTAARQEFANFYSKNEFQSLIDYYTSITIDFERADERDEWVTMNKSGYFTHAIDMPSHPYYLNTAGVCARFHLSKADGVLSMSFKQGKIFVKTTPGDYNLYFRSFPSWYIFYSHDDFLDSYIREYISIPVNTAATIMFSSKRYVRLKGNDKDSNCDPASDPYDHSSVKCATVCQETMYRRVFNCTNYYLMNLPKSHGLDGLCNLLHRCDNDAMLIDFAYTQVMEQLHRKISMVCSEECPDRCERTYYDADVVSERAIGDTSTGKTFAKILSSQNASAILLTVMHTAVNEGGILSYVEVSTHGFVDLVTDVGGTLGLFVGGTIMSIVQLAVFVTELVQKTMVRLNVTVGGSAVR